MNPQHFIILGLKQLIPFNSHPIKTMIPKYKELSLIPKPKTILSYETKENIMTRLF